ncbi:head maturation protease, ClpP-related [Aquabacterium sp.]|uniref:head maturation protease, ClpP-related n=1 Tax=Aquabacterium sp. TaxID=1872578 RepID=UPI0025C6F039|nr:head maturation protease, ClpP-related [Aquabacterium sp.]
MKLQQLLRDNASRESQPLNLVRNDAASEATLYIYDVIDPYWGIGAESVVKEIAALDPSVTLNVRINSPGGDVFDGRAMASAIRGHKGKTIAYVDGLAASAATTIAAACGEVVMGEGSFFMIHNSWSIVWGNKADMTDMAGLLGKIDQAIAGDYVNTNRKGKTLADMVAWMDAETWFSAEEAVSNGFADRIDAKADPAPAAANKAGLSGQQRRWNLAAYDKAPAALVQASAPPEKDYAEVRAANERRLRLLEIA